MGWDGLCVWRGEGTLSAVWWVFPDYSGILGVIVAFLWVP